MTEVCKRGAGRLTRREYQLSDGQRVALGRDRFFDVDDIASILGLDPVSVRSAIALGSLKARMAKGERRLVMQCKGFRVIEWRDRLAGLSDGDEDDFPKPKL